ncbi:unnamed protein product [Lampetra fluviatilis]
MEAEALRALPAALDDDALPALITIPQLDRSTLQQALRHMQVIYGPPSDSRHRFANRRRGESETPLAFRSALLALARAAFPRMDHEAIDALVLEGVAHRHARGGRRQFLLPACHKMHPGASAAPAGKQPRRLHPSSRLQQLRGGAAAQPGLRGNFSEGLEVRRLPASAGFPPAGTDDSTAGWAVHHMLQLWSTGARVVRLPGPSTPHSRTVILSTALALGSTTDSGKSQNLTLSAPTRYPHISLHFTRSPCVSRESGDCKYDWALGPAESGVGSPKVFNAPVMQNALVGLSLDD